MATTKTAVMKRLREDGTVEQVVGAWNDTYQPPVPMVFLNSLVELSAMTIKGTMLEQVVKNAIMVSQKLYMLGGICSTAIDMQIALANTPFSVFTDNETLNQLCNTWINFVNYKNQRTIIGTHRLSEEFYQDHLVAGNVFPYENWEYYPIKGKKYFMPMKIQFLNPLCVRMQLDNGTNEKVRYYNIGDWSLGTGLISDKQSSVMELKPTNMKRVARKGKQYTLWGLPYLMKAFKSIATKERLQLLDDVTTQGLIAMITIFSLYDEKAGVNAKKSVVDQFNSLLSSRPDGALYLTWGGPIKVSTHGPNGEILKFNEKYTEADKNLAEALGVPTILIAGNTTGSGGGRSGAEISIKSFKTQIEYLQEEKSNWVHYLVDKMARLNNLEYSHLEVIHAGVNLEDDAVLTSMMNNQRDRGVISDTSYALRLRTNAQTEEFMLEEEAKKRKDKNYLFGVPKNTPYQGNQSKLGGEGRPPSTKEAADVAKPVDAIKQVKDATKKKMDLKADFKEVSNMLSENLISILENKDKSQGEKLDAAFIETLHIANMFTDRLRAEAGPETYKPFFDIAITKANDMSLDIQQMVVKDKINTDSIKANFTKLTNTLFKEYSKMLLKAGENDD